MLESLGNGQGILGMGQGLIVDSKRVSSIAEAFQPAAGRETRRRL